MELQDTYYNKSEYVETVSYSPCSVQLFLCYASYIVFTNFSTNFSGFRQQSKQTNSTLWISEHRIAWQSDSSK